MLSDGDVLASRLEACYHCPHKANQCNGACPCDADRAGRDIHDIATAGDCPLKLFRGDNPQPLTLGRIAHGGAGLAKAAFHIDRSDDEIITRRTAICGGCEHAARKLGLLDVCGVCGCSIAAKVRIKAEKCPMGKW